MRQRRHKGDDAEKEQIHENDLTAQGHEASSFPGFGYHPDKQRSGGQDPSLEPQPGMVARDVPGQRTAAAAPADSREAPGPRRARRSSRSAGSARRSPDRSATPAWWSRRRSSDVSLHPLSQQEDGEPEAPGNQS